MQFYTIGYEKRELDEFISILRSHNIELLTDIRINPHSRKKGFSKKQLSEELAKHNIEYLHIVELGTPPAIREQVQSDGDYGIFFRDYDAYLKTQGDALIRLAELASRRTLCLMCFERNINECHRKVVAEFLQMQYHFSPEHL